MFPGAIYHVFFRGNARKRIFLDDADRHRFLCSLSQRVRDYQIRLYLYCLMANHVHLILETPGANLAAFMNSLLTSYAVFFNRRHHRVGHVTQGRYKSPLVEGNDYLLRLSRYVHLNPAFVRGWVNRPLPERTAFLHRYRWSSYPAYAGLARPETFVDYGPLLALVGRGESNVVGAYRSYVEAGLAQNDTEFADLIRRTNLGIGSEEFVRDLQQQYGKLIVTSVQREDVAFRRRIERVPSDVVLKRLCEHYDITLEMLRAQRRNDWIKPVAAWLLANLSGLSQRQVAHLLGVETGAAVCLQLKRLRENDSPQIAEELKRLRALFPGNEKELQLPG